MKARIKARWLKALRGGKYKQGTEKLFVKEGNKKEFCCLGVLCDLYSKERGTKWKKSVNEFGDPSSVMYFGKSKEGDILGIETLPNSVVKWAGLDDNNPDVTLNDGPYAVTKSLAELNDKGVSFKDIAYLIEKDF